MRIGISSLAWDAAEDEAVAALLHAQQVEAVDLVPGRFFTGGIPTARLAAQVRNWWGQRGIHITGMQALMFGTTGLNLFADLQTRTAMLAHLENICRFGRDVGATRLVFGSPKCRDRSGLSDAQAQSMATSFFRRLGDVAAQYGVVICLEPNPPRYGANFMINSAETVQVVATVAHPAIRMQLDTGALAINGEDPEQVVRDYGAWIGHVHASEPDLAVLGDGAADHARTAAALVARLPAVAVVIEMLPAKQEAHLTAIRRALQVAKHHYCSSAQPAEPAP